MKKAIVLFSGGIDSLVCLAIAKDWGFQPYALSFHYGQKHDSEIMAAGMIALRLGIDHEIIYLQKIEPIDGNYFPARNTIFLANALSCGECIGAEAVFYGANADDGFFPDCTKPYLLAMQSISCFATKAKMTINAPLLNLTKTQVIRKGIELGVDFTGTMTCYNGTNCGECNSCYIRRRAFEDAGVVDPIKYSV